MDFHLKENNINEIFGIIQSARSKYATYKEWLSILTKDRLQLHEIYDGDEMGESNSLEDIMDIIEFFDDQTLHLSVLLSSNQVNLDENQEITGKLVASLKEEYTLLNDAIKQLSLWIKILSKDKFCLQILPRKFIKKILEKVDTKSYGKMKASARWISGEYDQLLFFAVKENMSKNPWRIRNYVEFHPRDGSIYKMDSYKHILVPYICFKDFRDDKNDLLACLGALKSANIYAKAVRMIDSLCVNEIFVSLRPNHFESDQNNIEDIKIGSNVETVKLIITKDIQKLIRNVRTILDWKIPVEVQQLEDFCEDNAEIGKNVIEDLFSLLHNQKKQKAIKISIKHMLNLPHQLSSTVRTVMLSGHSKDPFSNAKLSMILTRLDSNFVAFIQLENGQPSQEPIIYISYCPDFMSFFEFCNEYFPSWFECIFNPKVPDLYLAAVTEIMETISDFFDVTPADFERACQLCDQTILL